MKLGLALAFVLFLLVVSGLSAQVVAPASRGVGLAEGNMHTLLKSERADFGLVSPPGAQTADSLAVVWDKPQRGRVEAYDVYLDGELVSTGKYTDYTFRGLGAAKEYGLSVRARLVTGEVLQSDVIRVATKGTPEVFDVTKYGAVGDGTTLNTGAIQSAIDACSVGGVVRIPAGVFVCGAIFLKSDMTLYLEKDAVLLGSTNPKDYPVMTYRSEGREKPCYASLINTRDAAKGRWRNITIAGPGKIDGSGSALRKNEIAERAAERGRLICIRDTDGVYLQDVTVRQAPFWCVHLIYCTGVSINSVGVHTRFDESGKQYAGIINGDGIDPDSCRDVFIFNCLIVSQDDGIALKSGRDADGRAVGIAVENVRISHCRFLHGFGVAMGSEMSGGLRNVLVEDCEFQNTFGLASIKAIRGRGNVIENVTYRDCTLVNNDKAIKDSQYCRGAIYVDQFYGAAKFDADLAKPVDETTPVIRNITFQNISVDTVGGNAIYLAGLPERPLENIRFENVTAIGTHGFIGMNIRGLVLDRVAVDAREGNAMQFSNVK